jgi:hypothetical protein
MKNNQNVCVEKNAQTTEYKKEGIDRRFEPAHEG